MLANYGIVPPQQIRPRSLAAVRRALKLDENSAEAHRLLAFIHWQFAFEWQEAIAEYERSLQLDPNSPGTTYWFGAYLAVIGFFDRAYQLLNRAQELIRSRSLCHRSRAGRTFLPGSLRSAALPGTSAQD